MMSQDHVKIEVLNILKAFDRFCVEKDLKYVLAYGTLLGAVRHHGFIPWDDDIDVVMTSDEYAKLEAVTRNDRFIDSERRYRLALPGDEDYAYSFAKVIDTKHMIKEKNISDKYRMGLFIDIFIAHNWPENRLKEFIQLKREKFLLRMNEICIRGNISPESRFYFLDKLLRPVDALFRLFGINSSKICRKMVFIPSKNRPTGYIGNISEGIGLVEEKMPVSVYTDSIRLPFEDSEFPAPREYDLFLTRKYGDYMTPPDPEDRTGHEFILDKDVDER